MKPRCFFGDLFEMYQSYAQSQGWRFEVMEANITGIGGYKEVIVMISRRECLL